MASPPPLAGAGIVLRPLAAADIETVRVWRNRDDVRRWFKNSAIISPAEQQEWFAQYADRPGDFVWIIEDLRQPGRALGLISVYALDTEKREAELGRLIAAPDARGAGHMISACRAVIRHCFDDLRLSTLSLEVMPDNSRAIQTYRRCGFRPTGDSGPMLRMRLERSWPEALPPANPPHPARTVWLASYPKSGNTWLRIFLANLLHPEHAPVNINSMPMRTPTSAARTDFDFYLGVPSAFLLPEEVDRLRPAADRAMAAQWPEPVLLRKAHDAYIHLADGQPLMGQAPDCAALYVLRDPCDTAVSVANHWSMTPPEAADRMLSNDIILARGGNSLLNQLPQPTRSWQEHIATWMSAPMPVHVMRYEEMQSQPLKTFRAAVRFLGFHHDDAAITTALNASRFETLQRQEKQSGFREAPVGRRFFRSGKCGEGAAVLSQEHRAALNSALNAVLPALQARGY